MMLYGVIVFIAVSYLLALLVDLIAYIKIGPISGFVSMAEASKDKRIVGMYIWGVCRMWTVTLAVMVAMLAENRNPIDSILAYMEFSRWVLVMYLSAPIMVFATFGIYYLLAKILKLVRNGFSKLREANPPGGLGGLLLFSYIASITVDAFASLGEEIGWRGYLLQRLGYIGAIRSALIIGIIWALWHASAIILLDFNIYLGMKYYNKLTVIMAYTLTLSIISIPTTLLVLKQIVFF